jgi:hypothetical protein
VSVEYLFAPQLGEAKSLDALFTELNAAQRELAEFCLDDVIAFLAKVGATWSRRDHPIQQKYQPAGLNFVIGWLRRSHLEQISDLALRGTREVLDDFCAIGGDNPIQVLAQPRGLVCHWLAGNVPMLGMLSLIQGLLTKNANLLKVSHHNRDIIPDMLQSMRGVSLEREGRTIDGVAITNALAAVYLPADDEVSQRALSMNAQVRVAWGGMDAVEAVMNLPRKYGTEDVIFGPRTSFAVIGRERLADTDSAVRVAGRLALDLSLIDQRGCNSPHTVFAERGASVAPADFARILAEHMADLHERVSKNDVAAGEVGRVLRVRAEYDIRGDAYYSEGMGWTVVYAEEDRGMEMPCYNHTAFVRPVDDVLDVVQHCSHLTQSAGTALSEERRKQFAKAVTARGVHRCPEVGKMTHYEVPWDGMFVMDRFVHWCTL